MKRMMKKALALVLTLLLVGSVAGCNQAPNYEKELDPKNPVSLEIWHYYNGPQQAAFDKLITEFNETLGREKGIVLQAYNQGNVSDLIGKVLDSINKKPGAAPLPDIFAAYVDTAYQVDSLELVAALDGYLTEEELALYRAEYLEEGRFDAKKQLKIFPTAKSTEILILNKTDWETFAQATNTDTKELETFEGLAAVSQRYYEWTDAQTPAPNDGKAFFGRDAMANYMLVGSKQMGVDLLQVRNGSIEFQLDEQVMRRLWDNYYVPYIKGYFSASGKFRVDEAKTGKIIGVICSTSGVAYFPQVVTISDTQQYPIEPLCLPTPVFEGAEPYVVQQGAGMVVVKSNPTAEYAATVFLKWFTDPQRNLEFSLGSGYLPVQNSANDEKVFQDALDSQVGANMSSSLKIALPMALQIVKNNKMYFSPAFEGGTAARNVLEDSLQNKADADRAGVVAALQGGATLEEAVAPYVTDANFDQWLQQLRSDLEATLQ